MHIEPSPTAEEAAAIVAALELLWPRPNEASRVVEAGTAWRFSGRSWQTAPRWARHT